MQHFQILYSSSGGLNDKRTKWSRGAPSFSWVPKKVYYCIKVFFYDTGGCAPSLAPLVIPAFLPLKKVAAIQFALNYSVFPLG